jgi:hypothetical protein
MSIITENNTIISGPEDHYRSVMCLKELSSYSIRKKTVEADYNKGKTYIDRTLEDVLAKIEKNLCVLPKGHGGACCKTPYKNIFTKKISGKFDVAVYSTPGNDGYIFKNRASRGHPITLTNEEQRKIKEKTGGAKLAFAIPLNESSTPFMMATMCFDLIVMTMMVSDIKTSGKYEKMFQDVLPIHQDFLKKHFAQFNRKIVNSDGHLICPVTGHVFHSSDLDDVSRTRILETDAQLGHCAPRSEDTVTIRGLNCLWMTREGNRLVGDHSFLENKWLDRICSIAAFHGK